MGKYSEELDKAMEENQRKAKEDNERQAAEMQRQAMEMQQQLMQMQQQAMAAGGMTPEMMRQMEAQTMKMYDLMTADPDVSNLHDLFGDDEMDEAQKQEFVDAHPQPEGMSKYLAPGSFFTVMRDEPLETLEMMGDVDDYIEEMDDSWGIDDRESLIEMIESLLDGRAYKSFNDTYLAIKTGKLDDVDEEDIESYQATVESLQEVLDISLKEINKCPSIIGWDIERAAYLARTGAHAEYITKDEAWDYLKRAAALAKKNFANWTEYAVSIVMGRAVHMGYEEIYFFLIQELLVDSPEFLAQRPLGDM